MPEAKFIERRKEYRLPYDNKVIYTDGENSNTAFALNISRGGIFVKTLEPLPIDTMTHLGFFIPNHPNYLCVKAKVAHIVFDRQRCEVDCGMGFQFVEVSESLKTLLNQHMVNEQKTYLELKQLLAESRPNSELIDKCTRKMPSLLHMDLLALRYRVNRICTLFDNPSTVSSSPKEEQMSA